MTTDQNQPSSATTPADRPDDGEWRGELSQTLRSVQGLTETLAAGKRKENNWRTIKWTFMGTVVLGSLLLYLVFYAKMLGFQTDPITKAVARVEIAGTIAPGAKASAERIVPLIERACKAKHVTALLLDINSGGGSPSEAERMIAALKACRSTEDGNTPKKVYALINGAGASAAYMIAMHTDEIYAGRYSIVGSIGAIIRYNDLSQIANKHGIWERAFRSAPLKGGPSMLSGSTPEDDQAYQDMVVTMGRTFLEEVKQSREGRLNISDELLFSGRVWTASEAKEYGLIDGIAVLEDLKNDQFKDATIHDYKQKSSFAEGMGMKAMVRETLLEAAELKVQ